MNFEPQKFFMGVIDFFSILLPGAVLTYLLGDALGTRLLGDDRYHNLAGTKEWVVFIFSSYLLGHFVFLLGSWLLDDHLYEPMRKATDAEEIKRLSNGGDKLSPKWIRWLASRLFKRLSDQADIHAVAAGIRDRYLDTLRASSVIKTFQWCKAKLTLEHPDALATIQRFEADSKFFRSFVIVLCVLIVWGLVQSRPTITAVSVLLLPLAFWRYVDQRRKATNQAYWYIITLEASSGGAIQRPSPLPANGASHAGGVVFRQEVKYLLVQAKNAPEEWVLPKGHIEPGEEMPEAAVREVREETGVWARIAGQLNSIQYTVADKLIKVQFYMMEAVKEEKPSEERAHVWLPLEEALHRATHDQTKDLLKLAEQKRVAL